MEITPALDEAFERMAAASFELPNGFVNHGAMACEALAKLGLHRRNRRLGAPVRPGRRGVRLNQSRRRL